VFLRQLFPEIGENFESSRLMIETIPGVALAFSVVAVELVGNTWTGLPAMLVDIPGNFVMTLRPGGGDINVLSEQYHFEILNFLPGSGIYVARMTHQVARAVSRDPRVGYVMLDTVGIFD
jgi:hypothetical protein